MVAPLILAALPALIGAFSNAQGKKADAKMQQQNSLMQAMMSAQQLYQSGIPNTSQGSTNNFLQKPLFGISNGGQ